MVRYLVSLKWEGLILSTIVSAFEAYGSALVGISPSELSAGGSDKAAAPSLLPMQRG